MTEIAIMPPEVIPEEVQEFSPLSAENYKDHVIQRKIIGFLQTGDSNIFKQSEYSLNEWRLKNFDDEIVKGIYKENVLREMLLEISIPFDQEENEPEYVHFVSSLDLRPEVERRIKEFIGNSNKDRLTTNDITSFLTKNPTPLDIDEYLDSYLVKVGEEQGLDEQVNVEKSLVDFFKAIYGDRFMYWQNFKLLVDEAMEKVKSTKKTPKDYTSRNALLRKTGLVAASFVLGATMTKGGLLNPEHTNNDTDQNQPALTVDSIRSESDIESQVEQRFGISILDVREAYRFLNREFDPYDQSELGNRPPTIWDEAQLELLQDLLPRYPESMYGMHGNTEMNFALTDFGENCHCAGEYHHQGLILLSDEDFRENKADWPGEVLSHELAHNKDLFVLERKLWPQVNEILGYESFSEARNYYMEKMNKIVKNDPDFNSVKYWLNYGFMGKDDKGLDDPMELVAVLSQLYARGPEKFMQIEKLFGKEKTDKFYETIKVNIYDGWVYGSDGKPIKQGQFENT